MDLKEAIEKVKIKAESAHSSFHAGRQHDAENYLGETRTVIQAYFGELDPYAGNVTELATSEKSAETLEETQAKVSGPGVHPAVVDPVVEPGEVLPASQFAKPNQ